MTQEDWLDKWADIISDAMAEMADIDGPQSVAMFLRDPDGVPMACWTVIPRQELAIRTENMLNEYDIDTRPNEYEEFRTLKGETC